MPFGRNLAVGTLHRHRGHAEAVARIRWLIGQNGLGVLTGEVGAGKTVGVRAALDGLDPSRHTIIYLANPAIGTRGIHGAVVTALGQPPRFHHATLIPQVADALAAENGERGRAVILAIDLCRPRNYADTGAGGDVNRHARVGLSRCCLAKVSDSCAVGEALP